MCSLTDTTCSAKKFQETAFLLLPYDLIINYHPDTLVRFVHLFIALIKCSSNGYAIIHHHHHSCTPDKRKAKLFWQDSSYKHTKNLVELANPCAIVSLSISSQSRDLKCILLVQFIEISFSDCSSPARVSPACFELKAHWFHWGWNKILVPADDSPLHARNRPSDEMSLFDT